MNSGGAERLFKTENTEVCAEPLFGPLIALRHRFEFEVSPGKPFSQRLKFSLPKSAAVSGFELGNGRLTVGGAITEVPGKTAASLRQTSETEYSLELFDVPAVGNILTVTVFSAAVMEYDGAGAYFLNIPIRGRAERITAVPDADSSGYIYKCQTGGVYCLYALRPRLSRGLFGHISIREYSHGTYYMVPRELDGLKKDEPITVTLGSQISYPEKFYLEHGGAETEVPIDKITQIGSPGAAHAFACRTINEMYKYIRQNTLAPESVIRLKKQAARLAAETGVLCPENRCVISFSEGDIRAARISLAGGSEAGRPRLGGGLSDPKSMTFARARELAEAAVRALMCCLRTDGSFTTPYTYSARAAAEQSAYAAAALRAVEKTFPEYAAAAESAESFARTNGIDPENIPVVFDRGEYLYSSEILDSLDVKRVSRLILSLKTGLWSGLT